MTTSAQWSGKHRTENKRNHVDDIHVADMGSEWIGKLQATHHPQARVARQLQKHMTAYLDRARQGYEVLGTVGTRTTDPYGASILWDRNERQIVIELTHGGPGAIRITRDRVECTHAEAREHFAVIRDVMAALHPTTQ